CRYSGTKLHLPGSPGVACALNRDGIGSVVLVSAHQREGGRSMRTHRSSALRRGLVAALAASAATVLGLAVVPAHAAPKDSRFDQINAVSDLPGAAPINDPLLVNPW